MIQSNNLDIYAAMESGIYNLKKPHIPQGFNKALYNNVITEEEFKHQTPLGAGMIVWANEKATL